MQKDKADNQQKKVVMFISRRSERVHCICVIPSSEDIALSQH